MIRSPLGQIGNAETKSATNDKADAKVETMSVSASCDQPFTSCGDKKKPLLLLLFCSCWAGWMSVVEKGCITPMIGSYHSSSLSHNPPTPLSTSSHLFRPQILKIVQQLECEEKIAREEEKNREEKEGQAEAERLTLEMSDEYHAKSMEKEERESYSK